MTSMEVDTDAPPTQAQSVRPAPAATATSNEDLMFPGEVLTLKGTGVRLGNGLVQSSLVTTLAPILPAQPAASANGQPVGHATATKAGLLRQGALGKLWVDNAQKRYVPVVDDMVLGVIIEKHAESYRLDIGASQPAMLPALAFEGATRKNKPNLNVGALVYARVSIAHRDLEAELSCTSPHFKKDWVTGQSLYGELLGGYAFHCSSRFARYLLQDNCSILHQLGSRVPFELAIGVNGRVWINSAAPQHTIEITKVIQDLESQIEDACARYKTEGSINVPMPI